ncbi:DJ-1/PfpI family protein [Amycolatopsis suaedae]|uniref:DJ-1/PfpI family protein n=1 Tax=Amycolatopsis suaedae TaxID=2510978 RepID=A0A4Q7J6H8_9PSEU|nr:DJ-1/PfpI family protein [Amycolatopsis suaedae]RZQ62498.1 DJ-1/PfpI family protein [Amycolatopsis suaedae]
MDDKRPRVAMLAYPGLTLLDMIGPHTCFVHLMDVHLAWKTLDPIRTDSGLFLSPTTTFADCPADVDVLFVPGSGYADVVEDEEALEFLHDRGTRARYVTSVCSGSLVLGAAGLMRGYRAATHWSVRDVLPRYGAVNVDERVVVDRNRISGGGVTAGLDFGLSVVAEMFGRDSAELTQLLLEYDPQPPFDSGSPEKAAPELTERARTVLRDLADDHAARAERLAERGWGRAKDPAPQPA